LHDVVARGLSIKRQSAGENAPAGQGKRGTLEIAHSSVKEANHRATSNPPIVKLSQVTKCHERMRAGVDTRPFGHFWGTSLSMLEL
jgi:hypothetical protein